MAYPHYLIEVPMVPASASTANTMVMATLGQAVPGVYAIPCNVTYNVTAIGSGVYQPLCVPHKIHRIGLRQSANIGASPVDLIFWKRLEGGATTWGSTQQPNPQPTGEYFRFMLPTLGATGKAIYKNVTGGVVVYPGETLCVGVSTVVADVYTRINLLVSPVWEQPGNITGMYQTTAP